MNKNLIMNLPIYQVTLNDYNEGITAISLVKNPAIESSFIYMSEDEIGEVKIEKSYFIFSNEEKGEVVGAILIPNKPIYREINGEQFYIVFSEQVISDINERMQQTGFNRFFTVDHSLDAGNAVTFLESWIKETEQDKSSALGINAPLGTLFVKAKLNTDFLKQNVKDGELTGFSVELNADIIKTNLEKEDKKEKMNYSEIYDKSVRAGESDLIYKGELESGNVLFSVNESEEGEQSLMPFSGVFSVEEKKYTVNNGLITDVEDVKLTLEEKVNAFMTALSEVKQSIEELRNRIPEENDFSEKVDGIVSKFEEQKLLLEQQMVERKEAAEEEKEIENTFDADNYYLASQWGKNIK